MLMQFHRENAVHTLVAYPSCEPFVGQKHFFISGEFIHVEDVCFHIFHRDDCGRSARNVAPVPPVYTVAGACSGYVLQRVTHDLHAAVCEITAVKIRPFVYFCGPKVAAVSCKSHEPFVPSQRHRAVIWIDMTSDRGILGGDSGLGKFFPELSGPVHSHICCSQFMIDRFASVRGPCIGEKSVLPWNQGTLTVRMASGHGERE